MRFDYGKRTTQLSSFVDTLSIVHMLLTNPSTVPPSRALLPDSTFSSYADPRNRRHDGYLLVDATGFIKSCCRLAPTPLIQCSSNR